MFDNIHQGVSFFQDALNGIATRQQTINNNLANADTPGYKGFEVMFEEQLQKRLHQRPGLDIATVNYTHPAHIPLEQVIGSEPIVQQLVNTKLRNDNNNVDLDLEMTKMAQASLSYSAVSQMIGGNFSALKNVIAEGGR